MLLALKLMIEAFAIRQVHVFKGLATWTHGFMLGAFGIGLAVFGQTACGITLSVAAALFVGAGCKAVERWVQQRRIEREAQALPFLKQALADGKIEAADLARLIRLAQAEPDPYDALELSARGG